MPDIYDVLNTDLFRSRQQDCCCTTSTVILCLNILPPRAAEETNLRRRSEWAVTLARVSSKNTKVAVVLLIGFFDYLPTGAAEETPSK